MANLVRPVLPALALTPEDAAPRSRDTTTTISTRRTSAHGSVQKPTTPARSSRKRPLPDDATPDARPPTKITVTQPHGELLRTTNGVAAPLGIGADEIPSRPGSAGNIAPAAGCSSSKDKEKDKRSLRSHDGGSRLKSDLATYFSSYEDIIAGVPKPAEFLDFDTPIYIVDEPVKTTSTPAPTRASLSPTRSRKRKASSPSIQPPTTPQSSATYIKLDYTSVLRATTPSTFPTDPLPDTHFFAPHRRAERKEKQLRNIEKERAMHEKLQLERLLDGLQGPDWLKVMGITGVTDGERGKWEEKRRWFVSEVEALVDKFRVWKEEEKRVRAEKDAANAARDEDDDSEDQESDRDRSTTRHSTPQDHKLKPPVPRRPPRPHGFFVPLAPPEPLAPFTTFFAKPHLRTAALSKHRHGRNAMAFGASIPEFEEREFRVPEEFLGEGVLRDNARQRRRRKRESLVEGGEGK